MAGRIRIGISGWTYAPWRGVFYPKELTQARELGYAAAHFPSIEINGSFYSLQRPSSYEKWREQTPRDFVFALKGSRYLTHMRRLRGVEQGLANFLASGPLALGEKLGPMLWQLPPNFLFRPEILEPFLELLPRDTVQAAELARGHEARLEGRVWLEPGKRRRLRHALEVRHESFACEDFIRLLRRYNVALVCADTVAWPRLMDVTADFVYVRLHGSQELYKSGYGPKALDTWAERVRAWAAGGEAEGRHASARPAPRRKRGRDVYVYFDNDAKVRAPKDALGLMRRLGTEWERHSAPDSASSRSAQRSKAKR